MAISQNSKITWEDIRGLFDRVNAERNRFKYTPDSPLNLQNQPAKAEIPNRLNDLIKTMNTNTFIKNGTSIANIGNFAVNVGELIIAQKLANMASLLGEIENIQPWGSTGVPQTCTRFNFCDRFAAGFSGFNARHTAGFTSFNARHSAGFTSFNAQHELGFTSFNARHTSGFSGGFNGNFGTFNGSVTGSCAMHCYSGFAFENSTGSGFSGVSRASGTLNSGTFGT